MCIPEFGGLWTKKKLSALEKYLKAYTVVLKKQNFTLYYIDGFAGAGRWTPKSEKQQINLFATESQNGSPKIALDVDGFHRYLFIEKDKKYCDQLNELKREYAEKNIGIVRGDANIAITEHCKQMGNNDRAVLFLDPFSHEVSYNTLLAIAATNKIDLWYLFTYYTIKRSPKTASQRLATILGINNVETCERFLSNYETACDVVRTQLLNIFTNVSSDPLTLYNMRRAPLQMLWFAVSNKKKSAQDIALRIANHIIKP